MKKKFVAAIAVAALAVSMLGTTAFAAEAEIVKTGTYEGTYEKVAMGSSIEYNCSIEIEEGNAYAYTVSFAMGGKTYSETENGTYAVEAESVAFTPTSGTGVMGSVSAEELTTFTGIMEDGQLTSITRCVSTMAQTPVTVNLSKVVVFGDTLESGSYDADISWTGGMPAAYGPRIIIDADADTFTVVQVANENEKYGAGTVSFDKTTGVYTLNYTDDANAGKTTTFTYDADTDTMTFSSGVWANGRAFDSTKDGVFVPYTAKPAGAADDGTNDNNVGAPSTDGGESDALTSVGKLESGAFAVDISWSPMKFSPILDINATNNTFKLYNATDVNTIKSSGTIAFDEATGVYTLNYTDAKNTGKTTTFVYNAETDTITFTSPVYSNGVAYNSGAMADDGKFFTYTAKVTTQTSTDNNTTTNNNAGTTTGTSPKTGDTTSSAWMIVVCAAAVAVVGVAARRRAVA